MVKNHTLTWGANGRMLKVAERDSNSNGLDWSAIYDPQVEFLEIGISISSQKAWKVYGPDLTCLLFLPRRV